MGYDRDQSIYALKVSGNNLEHACTFIMQNMSDNPVSFGSSQHISQVDQQRAALLQERNRLEEALNSLMQSSQLLEQRLRRGGDQ